MPNPALVVSGAEAHGVEVSKEPRLYAVNLSTGEVRGGPELGTVQHYDRKTGELTVHDYAPDSCDRCMDIAATIAERRDQ